MVSRIEILDLVPNPDVRRVHLVVKHLFARKSILEVQLTEENFLSSWKRLTKDQDILSVVEVYKIPFITAPNQEIIRQNIHMIPAQEKQGDKEISEKPKKGAILLVQENQKK